MGALASVKHTTSVYDTEALTTRSNLCTQKKRFLAATKFNTLIATENHAKISDCTENCKS